MNNNETNCKFLNFHISIYNYYVVISYSNINKLKNKINKDNNIKTGIYMWINKISSENLV
jgi:hypothetical protein